MSSRTSALWQGLAPAGQRFEAQDDETLDTFKLSRSRLEREQRACANRLVTHLDPYKSLFHQRIKPRMVFSLEKDKQAHRMIVELMKKVGGLSATGKWTLQKQDVVLIVSHPCSITGKKSSLTVHQDYELRPRGQPRASPPKGRSLSFFMVLGDKVAADNGATYVYLNSRHLTLGEEYAVKQKQHGGQNKKRERPPRRDDNLINPKEKEKDLKRKLGADKKVIFEGKQLSLFRMESAQWHGALNNKSKEPRPLLAWSYKNPELKRYVQVGAK